MMNLNESLQAFTQLVFDNFGNLQLIQLFDELSSYAPYIRGNDQYHVRQDGATCPIVITDATNDPAKLYWAIIVYRFSGGLRKYETHTHEDYVAFRRWLGKRMNDAKR